MKLRIANLSKRYPNGVQALDNVHLEISPGMFGLLGPNGAGKSTLMRTMATLQRPDRGTIHLGETDVLGQPDEIRKVLGYLPQEFGVYPQITAHDLLTHFATLKGVGPASHRREVVEALLKRVNLHHVRHQRLGSYSGGMKQRFGIAQALLGDPRLIIVDEPTAGLDPEERVRFHNLLSEIGEQIVVVLSTHIVEDVSDLCASMAIINKGKVVASGKPEELTRGLVGKVWRKETSRGELAQLQSRFLVLSTRLKGGKTQVHVFAAESPGDGFSPVEPDLEDVYFHAIRSGERLAVTA